MKIYKFVFGYVVQVYDPESKKFVSQEFQENYDHPEEWENELGESIDKSELRPGSFAPFLVPEMVQPTKEVPVEVFTKNMCWRD